MIVKQIWTKMFEMSHKKSGLGTPQSIGLGQIIRLVVLSDVACWGYTTHGCTEQSRRSLQPQTKLVDVNLEEEVKSPAIYTSLDSYFKRPLLLLEQKQLISHESYMFPSDINSINC